jgi:thioredoxin 1
LISISIAIFIIFLYNGDESKKGGILMVIHLTTENFEKEVLQSNVPVLVDFWATWCGPCQRVAPILETLSKEVHGQAKITKLDVDAEYQIADQFGIMSIPTLVVFKNGKVEQSTLGVQTKETLKGLLGL